MQLDGYSGCGSRQGRLATCHAGADDRDPRAFAAKSWVYRADARVVLHARQRSTGPPIVSYYEVMQQRAALARLFLIFLAALTTATAYAQFPQRASRAVYVGAALNVTGDGGAQAGDRTTPPLGAAATPANVRDGDNEPLILDLTLYDDGFAYGRLMLPRRGLVIAGAGSLQQGSELRLIFDTYGALSSTWQADLAHDAVTTGDPDLRSALAETQTGVMASFSGRRDMEFGSEGRSITGALAFTGEAGSVLNTELRRFAQYSTWEFGQGRIHASYTSPHLRFGGEALNDLLESGGRQRVENFVEEGRRYAADGVLGWAWEQQEYVTLEGLAGSYLSLLNTIYSYTGGAHPNTFFESYLFELRPSGVTALDVDDLFRPDSNWLSRLSPLILSDLERQDAAWVTQGQVAELTRDDLATFTLGPTGLTFHFAPYAMGPYVQGAFHVTVDYGQLVGLAPAGGALEQFARGMAAR